MNVAVAFLVKDPPVARLAALVEYLREVSDDFVFVVDDRTDEGRMDVLRSWAGVTVVPFTWVNDFAAARNAAMPHLKNAWVLVVDPDELPTFRMVQHIKEATRDDAPEFPLAYLYFTRAWWGGVGGPSQESDWHIRLWRTGRGEFYRPVHELVRLDGMEEWQTRGRIAVKAPEDAYLIHSKAADAIAEADTLYVAIERGAA